MPAVMPDPLRPAMVFHCPFPVQGGALLSANLARPLRMLEGFKKAGYRVVQITGHARQRRKRITRLKRLVARGVAVEFVYSETSNLPLFFNEPGRLPVLPFMEYRFFYWLRRKKIPVGLFLRDLHWRFPHFRHYPLYKRLPAHLFYWLDWLMYMSRVDCLFLPSLGLADHLPTGPQRVQIAALPPGCESQGRLAVAAIEERKRPQGLSLFYVGGVTPPLYDLRPAFACARKLPAESLVVCCRRDEWQEASSLYAGFLSSNVRIVHAQGEELLPYYQAADLFLFAHGCYRYMDLAMPFKIFEAVSYQVPILTFTGTEAARWIQEEGAGWAVRDFTELIALIGRLRDNPELIAEKRIHLLEVARKHSWTNRTLSVAKALGAGKATK